LPTIAREIGPAEIATDNDDTRWPSAYGMERATAAGVGAAPAYGHTRWVNGLGGQWQGAPNGEEEDKQGYI
jgi:hypothetical protein